MSKVESVVSTASTTNDAQMQSHPEIGESTSRQDARPVSPCRDEIAALAYTYWELQGSPEGNDLDNWFRAEESLGSGVSYLLEDPRDSPTIFRDSVQLRY